MSTEVGRFAGRHVLAEFHGVPAGVLDDVAGLRHALEHALRAAGATVCQVIAQRFVPQGVTVLALLSESHASVHTYPEVGSLFVDVFTCGDQADPELAARLPAGAPRGRPARPRTGGAPAPGPAGRPRHQDDPRAPRGVGGARVTVITEPLGAGL